MLEQFKQQLIGKILLCSGNFVNANAETVLGRNCEYRIVFDIIMVPHLKYMLRYYAFVDDNFYRSNLYLGYTQSFSLEQLQELIRSKHFLNYHLL